MPAATPLPRGPSVLTLYSADDLLTAPGCPVCRYAAEASDRYLGWFALEGHGEPTAITSLCNSLGMCPSHTRRLMAQPGAATRLTAVYRYVLKAARDRLAGGTQPVRGCPACAHDTAAADRALDTLLDGLADGGAKSRCRELGGVCIPHLADASASRHRRGAAWLAQVQQEVLASGSRTTGWLAGIDRDAETRAVLRQAVPTAGAAVPGACVACLAAAQAERDSLARLQASAGQQQEDTDRESPLCSSHLSDAAMTAAAAGRMRELLGVQAGHVTAARSAGWPAGIAGRWQASRRAAGPSRRCMACQARSEAERHALAAIRGAVHQPEQAARLTMCVCHHLALRASDQRAARTLAPRAIEAADLLIAELAEAFERSTQAHRHGGPAPGTTAWRRAAAYLNGAIFGGCPPLDHPRRTH